MKTKPLQRTRKPEGKAVVAVNLAKDPQFDHKTAALKFAQMHHEAQIGLRRVVAFGLFCFEMQEIHLKQGQFGRWLAQHHPDCARQKTGSESWEATSALGALMKLTKDVLESVGLTVNQYLQRVHTYHVGSGDLLLLPDAEVPKNARTLRGEICDVLDGKTARQLMLEFKQLDEEGNVKRGRLKNCKGTTREQREAAGEQKRLQEIADASERTVEWAQMTEEQCDADHFGLSDDASIKRAVEAHFAAAEYLVPLAKARGLIKGGKL